MRIKILAALILLCAAPAFGQQTVKQSGVITPGHGVKWVTTGVIADNGLPSTGGIGLTGIVITPIPGTTNEGIVISQSAPSGGVGSSVNFNHINIGTVAPENVLGGSNFVDGFLIVHQYGGGTGGRQTLEVESRFMSPSAVGNTNRNYVAATFGMLANAADGGSGGQFFASNFVANVNTGVTGVKEITGSEVNISVRSGATADYKAGWSIVPLGVDAVQGTTFDAGLSFSAISGAVGWRDVILFSAANGQHPTNSSSTLIASQGSTTVANFIDFSSYTCSSTELKFSNLTVSCGGVPTFTAQGTNIGIGFVANGSGAINLANGATASVVVQPNGTTPLIRGSASATALQLAGSSVATVPIVATPGIQFGSGTPLTLANGEFGLTTQTASGTAPGADGAKIGLICAGSGGAGQLIVYGGISTTPTNLGSSFGGGLTVGGVACP